MMDAIDQEKVSLKKPATQEEEYVKKGSSATAFLRESSAALRNFRLAGVPKLLKKRQWSSGNSKRRNTRKESDESEELLPETVCGDEALAAPRHGDQQEIIASIKRSYSMGSLHAEATGEQGLQRREFQLCVTVIEAHLNVTNADPYVTVGVGDLKRMTAKQHATNVPYFNEYFVFDFHIPPAIFYDRIIHLTVYNSKLIGHSQVLGHFSLDIGTVHAQPGHQFYHKWAVLMDPKNVMSAPTGYLKCSIGAWGKGDETKRPTPSEVDEDAVESNLLIPMGIAEMRQQALYKVRIHSAEALPISRNDIVATLKKAVGQSSESKFYVQINFAGHKAETAVRSGRQPTWDEQFTFAEMFPSLFQRMRLTVHGQDQLGYHTVATHHFELPSISSAANDGYLPTFGPTYVHLYGSAASSSTALVCRSSQLDKGLGQGVGYRGRLLVSLQVDVLNGESPAFKAGVHSGPARPVQPEALFGARHGFLLFGCVINVGMLEPRLSANALRVDVSMGGLEEEMAVPAAALAESDDEEEDADDEEEDAWTDSSSTHSLFLAKWSLAAKVASTEEVLHAIVDQHVALRHEATPKLKPAVARNGRGTLPFGHKKPCVFLCNAWYDQRWRLFYRNRLAYVYDRLESGLGVALSLILRDRFAATDSFRQTVDCFINDTSAFYAYTLQMNRDHPGNSLDYERRRLTTTKLNELVDVLSDLLANVKLTLDSKLEVARELAAALHDLADDPQDTMPDVIIRLMRKKRILLYCRVQPQDIIWSDNVLERGKFCSKVHVYELRSPDEHHKKKRDKWSTLGQVEASLWLGLNSKREGIIDGLPGGYESSTDIGSIYKMASSPPRHINYTERHHYELRCYLLCGRNLASSDSTGLSDPFARFSYQGVTAVSQTVDETLNPTWNETLVLKPILLYGYSEDIARSPPTVTVEIFDEDRLGKPDYMGRFELKPQAQLCCAADSATEIVYRSPKLEWCSVKKGAHYFGEVLVAADLILMKDGRDTIEFANVPPLLIKQKSRRGHAAIMSIPPAITPATQKFIFEVLFWGLRSLKHINHLSVSKPRMEAHLASKTLVSKRIDHVKKYQNFPADSSVQSIEVELPEDPGFWPAVSLTCTDERSFGLEIVVGTHSLSAASQLRCRHCFDDDFLDHRPSLTQPTGDHAESNNIESCQDSEDCVVDMVDPYAHLDWWSKYFASLPQTHAVPESIVATTEIDRKERRVLPAGSSKLANLFQRMQNLASDIHSPKSKKTEDIVKLVIFDEELETVDAFGGFRDWIDTFELLRGKEEDNLVDQRIVGYFKGSVRICQAPRQSICGLANSNRRMGSQFNDVTVRVYVVQAFDLHPPIGWYTADPYLKVSCGKTKLDDKEHHLSNELNPLFGRCFEFSAAIPNDSQLVVGVYDWNLIGKGDLIGETRVDLENRLFSKHGARCGIQQRYHTTGYNKWRNSRKPTTLLHDICAESSLAKPIYSKNAVQIGATRIDVGNRDAMPKEEVALAALHRLSEVPQLGYDLVPEHVETRRLFHHDHPGLVRGRLHMSVEIFPTGMHPIPPPVNIASRRPKHFELRVIVLNTADVTLHDTSVIGKEKMSDIYVKAWLHAFDKAQHTDVHYRSLTGTGNFNWRFIFPFKYIEAEEKIVFEHFESTLSHKTLLPEKQIVKINPTIQLQVLDSDVVLRDDFLGALSLNLKRFCRGAKSAKDCCVDVVSCNAETIDLFACGRAKGWWPFIATSRKSKSLQLTGKLEAEFHLLTAEEAEQNRAGSGRQAPQPLDKPKRPDTSFLWLLNPAKSAKFIIWKNHKWLIIKILVILLLVLLLAIFIYSLPNHAAKKLMGT